MNPFPKLLYWGDVPVAPTGAGAILLYRLLEAWPPDRLMLCAPCANDDHPLAAVLKVKPPGAPLARLFHSRVAKPWMTVLTLWSRAHIRLRSGAPPNWLAAAEREFKPEAILTIGVAGSWMDAAALARHRKIPLHLIVHDDGHFNFFWIPPLTSWGDSLFGDVYRHAAARYCISPTMERDYGRRYGVEGHVLWPSRGRHSRAYPSPRSRSNHSSRSGSVFYAGSISEQGFTELDAVARELRVKGHRLIAYTASRPNFFTPQFLEMRAPVSSDKLIQILHNEADLLLLWTTFEAGCRPAARSLFPSKMVDYTAAAVPVLVVAPPDASITSFVSERNGWRPYLTEPAPKEVADTADRIINDSNLWLQLAEETIAAGQENFSFEANFATLRQAIAESVWPAAPAAPL